MANLIVICGPQAVGKMTVAESLRDKLGLLVVRQYLIKNLLTDRSAKSSRACRSPLPVLFSRRVHSAFFIVKLFSFSPSRSLRAATIRRSSSSPTQVISKSN